MARRLELEALITVEEAAEWLRLSTKGLYRLCSEGVVPHVRVGRRAIRLRRSELEGWMAGRARGAVSQR